MSEDVILLAGLPGCGKTTHLCQMCGDGWLVFDDFKAKAFCDSSAFRKSRKFRCPPQKPLQVAICMTPGADSALLLRLRTRKNGHHATDKIKAPLSRAGPGFKLRAKS